MYRWDDEIWLLHVECKNISPMEKKVFYTRLIGNIKREGEKAFTSFDLNPGDSLRFIVSRKYDTEDAVEISFEKGLAVKVFRLRDRAYFPGESDIYYSTGEEAR
jgi:hypothetical protein